MRINNKVIITVLALAICSMTAMAQERTDTIKTHELQEVVVQAEQQSKFHGKETYIPTKQQRNAAVNGISLLQNLAISQLKVNPLTGSVTTSSNLLY